MKSSLIKRGKGYSVFFRVKGADGKLKAVCKALRDESGQAITTLPEAEKARQIFMEPFLRQDSVEVLKSIAHKIDDEQAEIARIQDENNPPLKVSEAWSAFLRSTIRHDCGKSSLHLYELKFTAFQLWLNREHPDVVYLRQITRPMAEAFLDTLNHGKFSSATFNFYLRILKYIFRVLRKPARLTENVWDEAQPRSLIQHTRRELTIDELKKVCQSAQGEMRLLFAVGLYTGLRLGDAATLKWNEVDLQRHQIRRIPNKTKRRNPSVITIPIHSDLHNMLAAIPAAERGVYVLPDCAKTYTGPARTLLVTHIQKHLRDCGIETTEAREVGQRPVVRCSFHSLRHTFVSLCRESGVALSVVESLVGHSNVAMTQHYSHTSELAAKNAVAMLPAINGDTTTPKPASMREILESMTSDNWQTNRRAALAMLAQ
jgi:integrase